MRSLRKQKRVLELGKKFWTNADRYRDVLGFRVVEAAWKTASKRALCIECQLSHRSEPSGAALAWRESAIDADVEGLVEVTLSLLAVLGQEVQMSNAVKCAGGAGHAGQRGALHTL